MYFFLERNFPDPCSISKLTPLKWKLNFICSSRRCWFMLSKPWPQLYSENNFTVKFAGKFQEVPRSCCEWLIHRQSNESCIRQNVCWTFHSGLNPLSQKCYCFFSLPLEMGWNVCCVLWKQVFRFVEFRKMSKHWAQKSIKFTRVGKLDLDLE